MGLILDSSVAIGYERRGLSAGDLLTSVRKIMGRSDAALSAITMLELEHGEQVTRIVRICAGSSCKI